jgi:hypothetical protein
MPGVQSPNNAKIKRLHWLIWKDRLRSASYFIAAGILILIVYAVYIYGIQNIKRDSVLATVDHWSRAQTHEGSGRFIITATLPDGQKITATASRNGRAPQIGEQIQLVKIVSVLGWTSYRWEPPPLTLKDDIGETAESTR